ncbi:hypothetical protein LXL04_035531 [Taraxacum kok-saghyz]
METPDKSVQLKVFVDKKKKKVMLAEADGDFIDILSSFFTLPLGTIARLSEKHATSKEIKVGSLTSLYESVANLNENHFSYGPDKDLLVNPTNPSASFCQKLKVNLDEKNPITPSATGSQGDVVRFNLSSFIITDDLNVVPATLDTSISLINSLGVENINLLEKRIMHFGLEEFSDLLKWSLLTNNPLTNLVFGGGMPCSSCATNSILRNSDLISSNSDKTMTLKSLVQKSNKKLICAQVENPFVELLFSFLTIPLGAAIHLIKDDSSPSGITNLYNSVSLLGDGKYLNSENVKTMLLCPKVSDDFLRVTDLLPVYEVNKRAGHFLKEKVQFIVFNDLEVIGSPSIATFSKFNTLGVPVGDLEVLEVSFGEQEALLLLKASLTSTSALTDFLNVSRKKPKVEPST